MVMINCRKGLYIQTEAEYTGKNTCVTKLYYAKKASQNPDGMPFYTTCCYWIVSHATLLCQCDIGRRPSLNLCDNAPLLKPISRVGWC